MKRRRLTGWVKALAAIVLAVLGLAACQASTPAIQSTPLAADLLAPSATRSELPSATPASLAETATPGVPAPDVQSTDTDAQQAITLAVADLSQQLSVPEESILVESVKAAQWPDASLGCPQPGMLYAQVVTPGYLIVLTVEDQTYEYHAGQDRLVVLCADLALPHPDTPGDSQLPIYVEMVQAPLSPETSAGMPPEDANPTGVYVFDPGDRSLLVATTIQILPTTEVLVGLSSATVPGRPYVASDLFQIPSARQAPLRVLAVDADTGTLTLAYAGQTFELSPSESRSFKQTGEGELAPLDFTTITNLGRPAAIGALPPDPGSP
jgi:hypothetical protein